MLKLRNLRVVWRRYRFGILLFGMCLSAILGSSLINLSKIEPNISRIETDASKVRPASWNNKESIFSLEAAKKNLANPSPKLTTAVPKVEKTVLANGLTVLTKEVHNAPVVTVQVWYGIGSRNEAPGVNGIAHQLEHMLFQGTKDRPIGFGRLLTALGASFNATTAYDNTAYFSTAESNRLTSLLTLEADRMQNSVIDTQKLAKEKRVVISELQGNENSPGYRLNRAVKQAAFPTSSYGLSIGGTKADVEKFTTAQVKSYYDNYYVPSNATLVVVGDFDTTKLKEKIQRTFGKVPRRAVKALPQAARTVAKKAVRQLTLKEPGSVQIFNSVYPLPKATDPDVPAIDVMNQIFVTGRSSRLYSPIIQAGKAISISSSATNLADSGWYEISALTEPGKSMSTLESAIQAQIKLLQSKGVTALEVSCAKTQFKSAALLGSRSIFAQAQELGSTQSSLGDYQYKEKYLAGIEKVTPADVQRVAKKYLQDKFKTVGYFQPTTVSGESIFAPNEKQTSVAPNEKQTSEKFNAGVPVDPAQVAKYLPPLDPDTTSQAQALPQEIQLKNGLRVFLLPDRSTPTVTLGGIVQAGSEYDRPAQAGVAALTASNLTYGTKTQTALALAQKIENIGAGIAFGASNDGVSINGSSLSKDLPILLQTLGDVLQNAKFPQSEFNLSREATLAGLKLELDDPGSVASKKFLQIIYPKNHPLTNFPTLASIKNLTTKDLEIFYRQHYLPNNTMLAIVGDFNVAEMKTLLENSLGKWQTTATSMKINYPVAELPAKLIQANSTIPNKTQSIILMGNKAIDRKDPRFYSATVLNQILGGETTSSRLGVEIRDRQGLTYGISSIFAAGKRQGAFIISMQTAPENAQKAIQGTISVLKNIQTKGITATELSIAKQNIASSYNLGLASPEGISSATLAIATYGLNPQEISDYPKKIQAITLEEVNTAAKELIKPDQFAISIAGPSGK